MPVRGGRRGVGRLAAVAVAAVALGVVGCSTGPDDAAPSGDPARTSVSPSTATSTTTTASTADDLGAAGCAGVLRVRPAGTVDAGAGSELSGMVASRANPGVWWVHNDSGAEAAVHAIGDDGALLATVVLPVDALDWEDVAIGGDGNDGWSLYLGDIGDNLEARSEILVHRITEPAVTSGDPAAGAPGTASAPIQASGLLTVRLQYPDRPHNAEAMFVDPESGDLVLVTKEGDGVAQVFVAPHEQLDAGGPVTLTAAGSADFGRAGLAAQVTGADISPDASLVVVRTYGGVHLFTRAPGTTVAEALEATGCEGPTPPELQGEAVAFAADGRSYRSVSEGAEPELHVTSR